MIGLGIDLCEIARIDNAIQKSDGFLQRYFTAEERSYLEGRGQMVAQSAAAMFAAKEAFLKALGTGLSGGIGMAEIGVVHDELGCPSFALGHKACSKLAEKGGSMAHLSLTHDAGVAAAVCILE